MGVLLPHTEHKYPHANSGTVTASSAPFHQVGAVPALAAIEDRLANSAELAAAVLDRLESLAVRSLGSYAPPTAGLLPTSTNPEACGAIGHINGRLDYLASLVAQLADVAGRLDHIA